MATAKKTTAKKSPTKKSSSTKTNARTYSPAASQSVEREMKAMKEGTLESGSGEKVTNPKQAIAIGLSEARRAGAKLPPPPPQATQNAAVKKTLGKKTAGKTSPKKRASA